jgi:hypothetical protein
MGLATDKLFYDILKADTELMEAVGDRLYNTVIGKPEVDELNEPVPYIIVMFAGLNNDETTKDDPYESDTDTVNIEIELAADNFDELTDLAKHVRKTIHDAMVEHDGEGLDYPYDYRFSTSDKTYNYMKPCYGIILNYSCSVENHLNEDDDEQD